MTVRGLAEFADVKVAPVVVAGNQVQTLVDDWPEMFAGQKRRVLDTIFSAVELDGGSHVSAAPGPDGSSTSRPHCAVAVYHLRRRR
ncbi:MAG TPA: hypothetical protein DCK98_14245 [Chloroflexi bacterium]|nr:hypothetical protein [Chloroflexota bacterium]HAL28772.1 hypothetical protein [Chloroflexota bacterium]